MIGSERCWNTFVGWPFDKTFTQGRRSDIPSTVSFASQCESVSGEMCTVQQKAQFDLRYAELNSVVR
jgi:hypothetical protein